MSAVLLSLAAFCSTLAGGLFALRFRTRLHFILAFTAGVLLGVVAFDLLPEIFALAHRSAVDDRIAMIALVAGFLLFHALERSLLIHHGREMEHAADRATYHHPTVGILSAFALAGHSFMDGVGIGFAFQVSHAAGFSVAIAVIAHDFCDGLNTVSLMLVNRNTDLRAKAMLLLDALAPILGAMSTLLFEAPPASLLIYLGFFAGFLLYLGATDILPEAHSGAGRAKALKLIGLTSAGAALVLVGGRLGA